MYPVYEYYCCKPNYTIQYLDLKGQHVTGVVAVADGLDARGHVEGVLPHARPVAHHSRLPNRASVLVPPGFVQGPTRNNWTEREGGVEPLQVGGVFIYFVLLIYLQSILVLVAG